MRATQTTSLPSTFDWIAAEVTVTCTIREILTPDLPTEEFYLINYNSDATTITLSPEFTQYPPCDYALDMVPQWTFDPSPAPVIYDFNYQYEFTITSDDLSKARVQGFNFKMTVTDSVGDQVFEPEISFDIELLHPCRRTSFEDFSISPITYKLRNG